jgi:peptidyl-dipeptidase Dcp
VAPVLKYAQNRELRKKLWTASNSRCDHGDGTDNKRLAVKIAQLRLERSRLLGFPSYADFVLDDRMAKTPAQVNSLLDRVRVPALAAAKREAAELQSLIDAEGGGFKLEPWDWYYYAEKVKKAKYDLDAEALSVYFSLDRVLEGAMQVAGKLYGVTFSPRKDIPAYHPEVRVFEVKEGDGRHIGLLYADFYPRPGKRGGGWTGGFRSFRIRGGTPVTPLVTNVCNFSRATAGKPSLLNPMEVETLFHEFGHALHSLFDQSPFQSLGSGGVSWDFVEVPSQIFENWLGEAQVVKSFARRYDTGEPIPDEALEKIRKARRFNQGFETLGYLAPCYLDLEWHALKDAKDLDASQFEKRVLERMGMPREVSPYHRTPYFRHVFAGGYAAGYYSYLWSEVLDADAFQAFKEKGDVFHPATAKSFRENILSKGNTEEAMTLYLRFRGAKPGVEPMLKKRGLMD